MGTVLPTTLKIAVHKKLLDRPIDHAAGSVLAIAVGKSMGKPGDDPVEAMEVDYW